MAKQDDDLDKLMKLTKLLKDKKVRVSKKGPPAASNKWKSAEPKFSSEAAPPPSSDSVDVGGMKVHPSVANEYEQWRQDKIAEQNERRAQTERRAKAEREARAKEKPLDY